MRSLDRNKQLVYFKNFTGSYSPVTDDDGYETGEYRKVYSSVDQKLLNVSAARGTYDVEQFGQNANYSKTIVTNDTTCTIRENSILWVGFGLINLYDTTHQYSVGEVCVHEGTIYRCKTVTTGTWVAANWVAEPHNYIVASVAKSINSITYAINEVKVNV